MKTTQFIPLILAALLSVALWPLFSVQANHSGSVIYVNAAAAGANDGSSWANAYASLQDALGHAAAGDQIWVAAGVYYPDEGAGLTDNNQYHSFAFKNGVEIYGGFAGTETQLSQRDPAANLTVLSGDIEQNDAANTNGVVTDTANIVGSNTIQVVTGSNVDNTAVLDGFIVTAGQANGSTSYGYGGGMRLNNASPTVANTSFIGSYAQFGGGGLSNDSGGSPTLSNIIFKNNRSAQNGGGIYNASVNSNPVLTNVTFNANSADFNGGGMYNTNPNNPVLTNVSFTDNSAGSNGGGLLNQNSAAPTLTNVTFSGNNANNGGGLYNQTDGNAILINVTIANNTAANNNAGIVNENSQPKLTNVILANGSGRDCVNTGTGSLHPDSRNNLAEDTGSDACSLGSSNGNITGQNPLLDSLTDFGAPGQQVYPLQNNSPAIDAGDNVNCPAADQRGQSRPQGSGCDIGAYEAVDNQPPAANAGADQTVNVGDSVALDGSGSSDPDGDLPLTYGWTQTGGPAVTLSDATAAQPAFTAPGSPAVLTFTLTVTDNLGLADPTPDEVVITVQEAASYALYLPLITN